MPRASRRAVGFVRALLHGGTAHATEGVYRIVVGERAVRLDGAEVRGLMTAGVLSGNGRECQATPTARTWLRRMLSGEDEFAQQHRTLLRSSDGQIINLEESPLARLAVATDGEEAFLSRHHVEAGERVRRMAERAQLQPRLTMSYDVAHTASGGKGGNTAAELGDLAAEARRGLALIHDVLPRDCAGVVLDVCGLLKGLQTVELERGWPRRSAKLVLRIGLDQLARHYGIGAEATGPESRRNRTWLGEGARPQRFE